MEGVIFFVLFTIIGLVAIYAAVVGNIPKIRRIQKAERKNINEITSNDTGVIIDGDVQKTDEENVFYDPREDEEAVAYTYELSKRKRSIVKCLGLFLCRERTRKN